MSKKIRILFQGDSITDGVRDKQRPESIGLGYVRLIKAQLGYEKPNQYEFINRGVHGNRIVDLYARIKKDIIEVKPDYLSILIGVNDVWEEFLSHNGVDAEKFEKIYDMLIEEIKSELPNVKITIMEPFCLRAQRIDNTQDEPNRWNVFRAEVEKRAEKAKKIAEKYDLIFIPLQEKFDEAALKAETSHWLADGVHPTPAGDELIKREWLKAMQL